MNQEETKKGRGQRTVPRERGHLRKKNKRNIITFISNFTNVILLRLFFFHVHYSERVINFS